MRYTGITWAIRAIVLGGLLISGTSVSAQEATSLQWFRFEAGEGTATGWYRWAVDSSVVPAQTAHLTVVSDSVCSVYVNGQRILKHAAFKSGDTVQARGFEIANLLRSGRNLIAVEVQTDAKASVFGISVTSSMDGQTRTAAGAWKTAPAPPPVGWQQTDFNDRDWPEIRLTPEQPEPRLATVMPTEYSAPVAPARVRNVLPFAFEDGDHVALVGATFIERAQLFEHLETTLAGTLGSAKVTFRNLGWSADTVQADSRGIFDRPEVGYLRMVEHIRAEEPTVVVICYGQNEALAAGMTPEAFARQLEQLIDELTVSGIPVVLMTPHELFPAALPLPSPSRFNSRIRTMAETVASVAQARQLAVIDMFTGFQEQMKQAISVLNIPSSGEPLLGLADNGMHLNDDGYACAALVLRERLLGIPMSGSVVQIDPEAKAVTVSNGEVRDIAWSSDRKSVQFEVRTQFVSPVPLQIQVKREGANVRAADPESGLTLTKRNDVSEEGAEVFQANSRGQYDELRKLILQKNELYFHRWRPQNITYLFGFRKHEQGNNAADIARFDPFIQQAEAKIQTVQSPQWQTISLVIE